MLEYYSRRANEYERIYQKPERRGDLARLRNYLREALHDRRVLELACGTGYWTATLVESVAFVTATDASDEVLAIARGKELNGEKVQFTRGDAFNPQAFGGSFDAGFAGFWWSHVPRSRLRSFLEGFHSALLPGARVVFADNRFVTGSSTPISRIDEDGNTYQRRGLDDGNCYEVLKNFPSALELYQTVSPYAKGVEVLELEYFWCLKYTVRAA